MSQSFVVNNVPSSVTDVTLLRFIRENSALCNVEHIQPFPDAYHHINDKMGTKSVQVFFNDDAEGELLRKLFENEGTTKRLVYLEDSVSNDVAVDRAPVRRLSVTGC
ncbi:hypothetical protein ZYGR_0AS04560 [Zygosaccharomyces rouxii]|uniref:RRM domain-containing protein n=1 Tax=Zygosaccharomyces rouxii TaxID=4956 RepID=A0A1Q3AI16_ZYGRO|nr:hypothetical protein ZYGR_0AS04560 [Zygosaccharomyces rouxii]